ncbi:MAG: ABC transporter permease [Asticcacaulis sp.]|nr:ABC transporter permease [Asticcacaulis sp.]
MYKKAFLDLTRGLTLYRVWLFQAWHEMSAKYKRTLLGPFWMAASTVVQAICLSLVWGLLMKRDMHEILPYILGGLICFALAGFMLSDGPSIFTGFTGMIRNHANPYTYYVFELVAKAILTFAHNVVVFYIVCACVGAVSVPHWSLLLGLPIVIVCMCTWGTVVGLIAARFRDLALLLPYIGQLLMYLSPVMWRMGDISSERAKIAQFNPFYGVLEIIRAPLLGQMAPPHAWALAIGTAAVGVIVWLAVYPPLRKRIPFWV